MKPIFSENFMSDISRKAKIESLRWHSLQVAIPKQGTKSIKFLIAQFARSRTVA